MLLSHRASALRRVRSTKPLFGGLVLIASLAFSTHPRAAAAAAPPACLEKHAEAQDLRRASKLLAAQTDLLACTGDPACPTVVRRDCAKLLEDLQPAIPSLVFAALDEHGNDTVVVQVFQNDTLVSKELTVQALELDPGEYRFRFVGPAATVKEETVYLREGEKNRRIVVDFRPRRAAIVVNEAPRSPAASKSSTARIVGYSLIAVGAVGLGLGTYFGLSASSQNSDSGRYCNGNYCTAPGASLRTDAQSSALASTVSFSAGLAAGAVGAAMILFDPFSKHLRSSRVIPTIGPGIAMLSARTTW